MWPLQKNLIYFGPSDLGKKGEIPTLSSNFCSSEWPILLTGFSITLYTALNIGSITLHVHPV
jgi:hypothetical protein